MSSDRPSTNPEALAPTQAAPSGNVRSPSGRIIEGPGATMALTPEGTPAPMVLTEGAVVGKYRIEKKLGEGGMSAVYRAVHTGIGKAVAIKVLSPALAVDPQARARFLREAEAASRLQHPHVVDVDDFGAEGAMSYLVMELLRGEDFSEFLQREGRVSAARLADLMLPVCAAIQAAHAIGVVHRDLKPQNIFLARTAVGDVVPKVLDFGISKIVDDGTRGLTSSGTLMGTPHYLAPEMVAESTAADARSDQYALGVILYQAATGARPCDGATLYAILSSIAQAEYRRPRELVADLPPGFEEIILRAMQRRPIDRFPSVHALGAALLPYASERGRILWSEYFSKVDHAPQAGVPTDRTAILPDSRAEVGITRTRIAPATPSRGSGSDVSLTPIALPHQRGRGRLLAVAGAVVVAVGALVTFLLTRPAKVVETTPAPTPTRAAQAPEARPSPPPPAPAPPAPAPVAAPPPAAAAPDEEAEDDPDPPSKPKSRSGEHHRSRPKPSEGAPTSPSPRSRTPHQAPILD